MDSTAARVHPASAVASDSSSASAEQMGAVEDTGNEELSAESLNATVTALQRQAAEVTGQVQRLATSCQQRQHQYIALTQQYATLLAAAVESYTDDVAALCDTSQQLLEGCEAIERELQDSKRVETLVAKVRQQVLETEAFVESIVKRTNR